MMTKDRGYRAAAASAGRIGLAWAGIAAVALSAGAASGQNARKALEFVERPGALAFTGELIVRPLQNPASADKARAVLGGNVRRHEPRLDHYMVTVPEGHTESTYATELMATGLFEYAHPNYICYPAGDPDDPFFAQQWHHVNIQSSLAWDMTGGSTDLVLAFTDTGIDTGHPELAPYRVPGYNAVDKKAEVDGGQIFDVMWHGTHVAGCAAAVVNNGQGVAGVGTFGIMMVRVSNDPWGGSTFDILYDAAMWAAENGAKVVSTSYTGVEQPGSQTTGEYLKSLGVLYLYAADNYNQNHAWDYPDVIVVGATDINDNKAGFSSYGNAIDVVAPGVNIYSTWIGGYGASDGTSFATPITNGICGLILALNPKLSVDEVKDILNASCDDIGAEGEDNIFGHGRVNAYKAAQLAKGEDCYADYDGNGELNLFDFLAYTNDFNAGKKGADCDGSEFLNLFDFLCFTNVFNLGC